MRSRAISIFAAVGLAVFGGTAVAQTESTPPLDTGTTEIKNMVARLDLDKYKATIKGPTQFGDRRQGTDRNRAALDWIETQLKSYGCANTERIKYVYTTPPPAAPAAGRGNPPAPAPVIASGEVRRSQGGSRLRGNTRPTGVNTDPMKQPDPDIRQRDMQPATDGPREEVYCTKIGTSHPNEMYIVSA